MKKYLAIIYLTLIGFTTSAQKIFVKNDKYGIKDDLGKVIVKAKYDYIDDFKNTITIYNVKDKYGIINMEGVELTPPIYQDIKPIGLFTEYIDVQLYGKWGAIDEQGNVVIAPKYYDPIDINFLQEYSIVTLATSIIVSTGQVKTKLYGVIDNKTLKEIIRPIYISLRNQDFGYFEARIDENNKKYGLIDNKEQVIFPMEYATIFAVSKDIIGYEKDKKFVLVNSKGYSISSTRYEELYKISENRAKVRRDGKYGFIDEKGKEVIACKYEKTEDFFYNGKVKVELMGAKIEIDSIGNEVTTSETIKPRNSLVFHDEADKKAFDLINFKENVSASENLKLIDNFLNRTTNYTAIIKYIDNLMSEAANNKLSYKQFADYLYGKYSNSPYVCYDAIPIHISQKYMCNPDAPYGGGYWLGEQNKKDICNYAKKNKTSLCGEIVSDVNVKLLPQTNSKYLRLEEIKSKYTLLLFWSNECPSCEKQIQLLASSYAELKQLGVEIVGISKDYQNMDKAEQLIVNNNMDWINVVDVNHKFLSKLNVSYFPYLFLLDKDKKIIIKNLNMEQTINYLKKL